MRLRGQGDDRPAIPAMLGRAASLAVPGLLLCVAGCGRHDAVDTPVSWWHQLQGGAIAEQRPPPPGVNDPYPKIGTTPTKAPEVASMALRKSVTDSLVAQRNLSARLNANDPLPPPATTPGPGKAASKSAATATPPAGAAVPTSASGSAGSPGTQMASSQGGAAATTAPAGPALSSASFDAADAPSPPPEAAARPAASTATAQAPTPDQPELALPEVTASQTPATTTLPPIPDAPPPPPGLPNISVPRTVVRMAAAPKPAFDLATPSGTVLRFAEGSDVLQPGQDGALRSLASSRHGGTIFVHGFGDAADASPEGQAQAVTLAALRARRVAERLQADGVPGAAIRLRAAAFGRGASAALID
ncbi:OmpA family protein [Rhizosaccharibacter radicis]|uniref:OmpA-like domain-containing protein n=1 Tax=Rhizosaccharibacter radicis TaxID=2782605 RepID=A0ABT1VWX4_9PROT|nr:hypothetical protein [Acetobacteraceae bacterium KSS12]